MKTFNCQRIIANSTKGRFHYPSPAKPGDVEVLSALGGFRADEVLVLVMAGGVNYNGVWFVVYAAVYLFLKPRPHS